MTTFFLPAITFLKHLKFSHKIAVASIIFFVPVFIFLAISGNNVYNETKSQQKLKRALVYTNALKTFYVHIPAHRGMMNAWHYGDRSFDKKIEEVRIHIKEDIKLIDALTPSHAFDLNADEKWQAVKSKCENKLPGAYSLGADECFALHTELIEETAVLIMTIGEQFRTSMSRTDLFEFYAMKILTEDITTIAEYTGRIRGIGAGIVAKKTISDEEQKELATYASMLKAWLQILSSDINSLEIHADHHIDGLDETFESVNRSTSDFLSLLDDYILKKEALVISNSRFFQKATDSISLNFKLYDQITSAVDRHIQEHIDEYTSNVFVAVAILFIMLFVLFYFNTAFYIAFMDSLHKIKVGATLIGKGRYATRIDLDTKDELLVISDTFNKMAKNLQQNNAFLNSYKNAIDQSAIISIADPGRKIIHANDKFCEATGYTLKEVIGQNHNFIRDPETPEKFYNELWQTISAKRVWQSIVKNRKKSGEVFYVDTTIVPIVDEKGSIVEFIAIRKDVTELIESKHRLVEQLYTDSLTGLDNRRQLLEDLKRGGNLYLILINIDRYREVNDYHGYATGDELLIALKNRLLSFTDETGSGAYRLHADEFALLLDEEHLTHSLPVVMETLHAALTEDIYSVISGEFNLDVTLSAAAKHVGSEASAENLLINADLALRSARKKSLDYLIFDSTISLKEDFQNNLTWTRKLKEAIKDDRIVPYFQPIINNETKKIEKYECLMRLIEKDGSVISPFFFMETAKKAKLYTKLTRIMVKKSLETFQDSDLEFSINLSADDILDKPTVEFIKKSISDSPLSRQVIFEIVESEGIENFEEISNFIHHVKSLGCKIAIDDFGTGYSNFEYLLKLNIDIIKIDGSLIKNIHEDKDAQSVVETVVNFAGKLNAQTVGEFVHSQEVAAKVDELNIGFSQGFYYSEPKKDIQEH